MSDRPTSGQAPQWGEYAPPREPQSEAAVAPTPTPTPRAESTPSGRQRPVRSWDIALTVGLLAVGVLYTLTGIPGMLNLPETLRATYAAGGYGTYTSDELASAIGIAINVTNVVLLIAAVALSTASLRARRITFWLPLTAGVIAFLIGVALLAVAMLSDPAFAAYLDEQVASTSTSAP